MLELADGASEMSANHRGSSFVERIVNGVSGRSAPPPAVPAGAEHGATKTKAAKLGRYTLVREIARGGMAIVWLAEARGPAGFAKTCVVKELLPELASDPRHRAMFLDEARLAARLAHKNIVQTNDLGEDRGRLFMALELLEGATLRRLVTLLGKRRLAPALAVRVVAEVLAGLSYAHDLRDEEGRPLGIVHRDVSPSNVFVTFDGQVKVLDFGVARSRAHRDKTREGFVKGTAAYMSPDHVATRPIDVRADVFTAGVLLRELLVGERLWGGSEDVSIVRRLVASDIPAFPEAPAIPAPLRAICVRAMAEEREARFPNAKAMRDALEAWLAENDPNGSLADLRTLWATTLAHEPVRIRMLHRTPSIAFAPPSVPPPLPAAARRDARPSSSEDAPTETDRPTPISVASEALVTDEHARAADETPTRIERRPRAHERSADARTDDPRPQGRTRFSGRELFVMAMAIVAVIAATVSVTATVLDDPPPAPSAQIPAPP